MSTTSAGSAVTPSSLRRRIDQLVLRDRYRLRRRLTKARDKAAGKRIPEDVLLELAADVEEAERRLEARRAAVPKVTYPPQLPVSKRVDDLAKAIACGADAVMLGAPLAGYRDAPGRGLYWTAAAAHPSLPRSRIAMGPDVDVDLETLLYGPSFEPDGRINLFGALRRAMAKTGYSDLKEFQKVGLTVRA